MTTFMSLFSLEDIAIISATFVLRHTVLYNNTYNIFTVGLDFSIRCSDVMEEGWHKTTHNVKVPVQITSSHAVLAIKCFQRFACHQLFWVFTEICIHIGGEINAVKKN